MDEDLSSTPKQESLISGNSCTHTYGAQSQKRKHGNRPESFTPYSSQNSTLGIDSKKSNQHFNDFESVDMNMLKTNAMACLVSSSDVDYLHNLENTPRCLNVEGIIHDDTRHQKDANINPIIRDSILSNFQCDNVISERDIKSINMVFDNQSTDIFTEQVIGQSNFSKTIDNSDPNQNALVEGISNNKSIFSDKAYNEIKQENSQACSLSYQNQVASVNITETYPFETIHRKLDTISYNGRLSNRMKNIEIQLSPVRIRIAATLGEDSVEHVDQSMEIEVDSDNNDPEDPVTDEQEANDIEEDNNESIGHAASTGEAIVSSVENTVSAEVNEPLAKVEIAATFSETSTSFSNETKNTSGDELKLAFVDEILTENEEKTLSSEFKDIIHHEDQQVSDIVSYTAGLDKEERRTEVGDQDIDEGVDVSDMDDLENLGEMKVDAEVVAESENGNNKKESKEKMFETSKQSSSDIGNEGIATIQKNEIDENENGCEIEDDDSNSLNEEETYMKENDNVVDEDIKDKHEECSDEKQDGNIETDAKEEREKNVETDIDKGKNEDIIRDTLEKEKTSEKNDSNNSPKNQVDGGETHEDSEVEKKNVTEAKSTQELEEQTASNHEGNIQAVCTKDDPDITERKASKEDIGDEITENIEKNQDTVTEEKDKSNNDSDDSEDVINENTDNSAFNSEKNTELGSVPVQESSQEDILELQMESGTTQNLENNDDQTKFAIKEPTALSTDEINAMENSDQVSQEELKNLDEVQLKETEYINEELNEDNQDTHISDAANQLNAELVDEHDAEDEANNGDEVADSNIKILSPKTKETEVSQALQNTLQQETENKDKESKTYIAGEEANKEEEQGSSEQGENGDFDHEKMNSKDFKEFSKTSDIESNNTVDDSLDIVERKETYDDIIEETVDTVDENVTEDSTASLLENIHHNYSSDRERNDDITEETCPKDTEASENCPEEETNAMCAERADQEQQEKTSDAAENECVLLNTGIF
ncbi:protein PFC0760c-like [Uloborus diversus]|uniref:protein PFC0760c-like n=1 Tax=Uloborus diversus TaxID=327109 RepID=UPI0024098408|nr:protein PFC0760c-like [Uloborus diversus]